MKLLHSYNKTKSAISAGIAMLAVMTSIPAAAITLEQAKQAYSRGDYSEAVDELVAAAKSEPKNQALNQMAGVALMRTGDTSSAVTYLKRGQNESNLYLAQIALLSYNIAGAETYLESYDKGLGKGKRKQQPSPMVKEIEESMERTRSMLDRVAAIEIIDSIAVDREDFFRQYRLASSAGRLEGEESLPRNAQMADPVVVYVTENGRNKIWSAPDEEENYVLVRSSMLDDGSWEVPHPLGEILNEDGDANYPFLMSDGVTLYFANDGVNSLGGYDIFIASDNGEEFLQPQNMGMPFNSPYDDYMLAIDEESGLGWWATDRNQLGDKITIYKFIPQDYRKNYAVDTPGLASLALAKNIRATWVEGKDYTAILQKAADNGREGQDSSKEFDFALPGGRVYHHLSDFKSEKARRRMKTYLDACDNIEHMEEQLANMRLTWKQGNHRDADRIRQLESNIVEKKSALRQLANDVIRSEK